MSEDLTHTTGPLGATVAEGPPALPASPPGYELRDEIGHGGMGVVYRARDVTLDRDVAVKLLSQRYPADSLPAQRFLSEARITGQLQHPGIPAVHQVGALADGRPFLAMKLIKGNTLEAILKHRPDSAAERGQLLAIFEAVCQAVGYAHAHRVIHRDLKPANVMVGAFGEVQVMDWGLAKVLGEETPAIVDALVAEQTRAWTQIGSTPEAGSYTQAGSLVGTPAFIPPEQALGEIEKVNERSDVFGLGALLAVILTGKPPYVGENYESVRVQAVRGKLEDCFARLDGCGAEPELVALCKKCLAFELADRPADAGAVAAAVAGLRAAADERARRAELDKVRMEGEKAAAEARALERRKRRRLWLGAAAALVLAAVGGLSAVLTVQRRANADLTAKNVELDAERAKVQTRFDMAAKAIGLFHTSVSEYLLLQNPGFKELRTKLLKQAAGFYGDLEQLLAGESDAKSRKALAAAYYQLGELTDKIGDKKEALAVHRKALALRRELAAVEGADVETRLDVARSLEKVGGLLTQTGDKAGALAALEEQRDLAERLDAEHPTEAIRYALAQSHNSIGVVHYYMGKPEDALTGFRKSSAIQQTLADANPADTDFQRALATSQNRIGVVLMQMGKLEEALAWHRKALVIRQKLADANPTATDFQRDLATSHKNIGMVLDDTGKPEEALTEHGKALTIGQKLADANPAVAEFQYDLAGTHGNIGIFFRREKPEEALASFLKMLALMQKLADANPSVTEYQRILASSHGYIGDSLLNTGRPEEALASLRQAMPIHQKLADANPSVTEYQCNVAWAHALIGECLKKTGKWEQALVSYRNSLAISQKTVDADPTARRHISLLADAHLQLGRLLARQKQFAAAFTHLDASVALRQKWFEAHPKNPVFGFDLGLSYAYRGWALVWSGQPFQAAADLRRAVELWAKVPATASDARFERSRALALLAGLGGDAKSGVTKAEAAAFADQAVAALRDAINAGWNQPDELKEPDFDALRGPEDFKKLLAEVEAKARAKARPKD